MSRSTDQTKLGLLPAEVVKVRHLSSEVQGYGFGALSNLVVRVEEAWVLYRLTWTSHGNSENQEEMCILTWAVKRRKPNNDGKTYVVVQTIGRRCTHIHTQIDR